MEVIRVNLAKGTLRDVVHGEPEATVANLAECLKGEGRGPFVTPPPIRDCAGGVKLLSVNISDMELLRRYFLMELAAREVLVRSLCDKMHAHRVRDIEVEVEWSISLTRTLSARLRNAQDNQANDILYLTIMPVKK